MGCFGTRALAQMPWKRRFGTSVYNDVTLVFHNKLHHAAMDPQKCYFQTPFSTCFTIQLCNRLSSASFESIVSARLVSPRGTELWNTLVTLHTMSPGLTSIISNTLISVTESSCFN